MPEKPLYPPPTLKAGDRVDGFEIQRVTPLPEIRAQTYEILHPATGARVLHLHCGDRENLYAVVFRTPPPDSTGVAHILEHSVLAGSEKYPVKDAFNHLVRSSLNTFLNAFTGPDFTCYPICSQVRADFFNLAAVYSDLVLRPLLKRFTFLREGHHLELSEKEELTISGIVYNEMKGAFSTPERVSESTTLQGLFPDTPYGVESGGRPSDIPNLTYENFAEFHRRYYSPANARFFIYGDIPTRDHLQFLAEQLAEFGPTTVDSDVPDQARWPAPREVKALFPVGPEDPLERKSIVNVAWLTAPAADVEERIILEVLAEALVGNAAAPLRQALIKSGLGQDLSPLTGLITWYKQLPFSAGLRGTDADKAEEIESLTLETLERIAREGFPGDLLEAAFHQVEYRGREITRSPFPFSITLLFRCLNTWLHDNDPLMPLSFAEHIQSLRRRWQAEPELFQKAIRRWLIENPHRLRSICAPSPTLADEREAALKERLAERKSHMSAQELKEVRSTVVQLREDQRAKDSAAAVDTLPKLQLDEIPRGVERIPTKDEQSQAVRVMEHDLFSNGIGYLDVAFDVSDVPEEMQRDLPLLGAAATGMGAGGAGYAEFATRKALKTGGVSVALQAAEDLEQSAPVERLIVRARALQRNIPDMVRIVQDILVSGDLGDTGRLRDVLSEERNQLRAAVAPHGHLHSGRAAAAGLSRVGARDESWHGALQLRHLGDLTRTFEDRSPEIKERLAELRRVVFRRDRMTLNLTGDAECLTALRAAVEEMSASIPEGSPVGAPSVPVLDRRRRGVAIPGEVCYVARVLPVPRIVDQAAPALWALAAHLRTGFLYKKIRVEGGAYGGLCLYDPLRGLFSMMSYRDPHLTETLDVYDAALEHILGDEFDEDELRTTIISAVSRLERPLDPAAKGLEGMVRTLLHLSDEERQRFREMVLSLQAEDLRRCVRDVLLPAQEEAGQAVYAPRNRILEANERIEPQFSLESID
ncbi:MAG: hypothetical protein GF355_01330 [Candidatus Eisenbacteria bacterium]|nr:hypothetical protein [Candidatus Eisenbacteria bacterium]